jgi:nicotinamide-nucleotide amidase
VIDPLVDDGARALVALLTARGETVATAESLTAGLLAATVAGVPGASAVLSGGLVTYTVETKILLAGVPRELLDAVGPVAAPTAAALAEGARALRCDLGSGPDRGGRSGAARRAPGRHRLAGTGRSGPDGGHRAAAGRLTLGHPAGGRP